jgi:hypothetical protein
MARWSPEEEEAGLTSGKPGPSQRLSFLIYGIGESSPLCNPEVKRMRVKGPVLSNYLPLFWARTKAVSSVS